MRFYRNTGLFIVAVLMGVSVFLSCNKNTVSDSAKKSQDAEIIKHGEYIVRITGCNDCHTPGYPEDDGNIPVEDWLTGSPLGWRGPWGTTYAPNLRLYMQTMTEEQWLDTARNVRSKPPMPWYVLRDMTDSDLIAMYRFIKNLGPAGELMPQYVPPGETPSGPYVDFPN